MSLLSMEEMGVIVKAAFDDNNLDEINSAEQPNDALHEPEGEIEACDDVSVIH